MIAECLTIDFILQEGITTIGTEDSDEPQDICKLLIFLSHCLEKQEDERSSLDIQLVVLHNIYYCLE